MGEQPRAAADNGVRLGQHICSVAEHAGTQLDLVAPIFRAGLESNCQCIYVSDRTPPRALVAGLRQRGCDIEDAIESGRFVLATADELYVPDGHFDPSRMLDTVAGAVSGALQAGFRGWCGAGELSWLGRRFPGTERVLEYEFGLNHINGLQHAAIVCLYNGASLAPSVAREVESIHPLAHRNGSVVASQAYDGDPSRVAELPLLEDLEPAADELPCGSLAELVSAASDSELLARRCEELDRHTATCDVCSAWVAAVRELKRDMAALRVAAPVPDDLLANVRSRLRSLQANQ
jgi:hypothetical protein